MRILVSLKSIEILYKYAFILIPGVGHGAASDCPQQLTMICLMLYQGHDFASSRQFLQLCDIWNSGDLSEDR